MTFVVTGVALLVTAYHGLCVAMPARRDPSHRVELDVAHTLMGATMAAMVWGVLPPVSRPVLFGVFGLGLIGSAIRVLGLGTGRAGRAGRARYARVGVVCAAMLPMLVPSAAGAAPPSGGRPMADGHAMAAVAVSGAVHLSPASIVGVVLVAALLAMAAERLIAVSLGRDGAFCRLGVLCEVAMAAVMGCLLAAML